MHKVRFCEDHAFLIDLITEGSVCLDLGGNYGRFADYLEANTNAAIVSVEPVSYLFEGLPSGARRQKVRAAVAGEPGEAHIHVLPNRCASAVILEEDQAEAVIETVPALTFSGLAAQLPPGDISLVKVDIEGAEFDFFLKSEPEVLKRAYQYTVEFHDFLDASLTPSVHRVYDRMKELGFAVIRFSLDNTNVLFVRQDKLKLGFLSQLWLGGPVKYTAGIKRRLRRRRMASAA